MIHVGINHGSLNFRFFLPYIIALVFASFLVSGSIYQRNKELSWEKKNSVLINDNRTLAIQIASVSSELLTFKNQDQKVRNDKLESDLKNIHTTYLETVNSYEELLKVKELSGKTEKLDILFASALKQLSKGEYASAEGTIKILTSETEKLKNEIAAAQATPTPKPIPVNNSAHSNGFNRQTVSSDIGNFLVDVIAADLSSTRVIVDSASDSDCKNDCPVTSLGDYVTRSGGYAGINGSYFCPSTYPSCQDKKNSFDTLLMNKNKKYINSDNNVYSNVPAVIFLNGSVRFVGRSLEWGRDTGVDGVLANQPLLLNGGNIQFIGDDDPKKGSRGPRSFVGNKGNTVYIGVIYNATVAEAAHVTKTLGFDNALNLDSGGSTALWFNGYKVGPGRNIPNAIVFVRK